MPIQAPQWTEFLSCPICCHKFDAGQRGPISLGCGHTVCRGCLSKLQRNQCPYDQTVTHLELDQLPVNGALLSLVNSSTNNQNETDDGATIQIQMPNVVPQAEVKNYYTSIQCIKELALLLKPFSALSLNGASTTLLSRPMQRKLVTLINCQLVEVEGRSRALRAARSLGERTVMELILHHQNHLQLSANLWAAVRSRGCQFLGPAMQEEVLKLVLLALEDGSSLSRKVLVMFVVQRLEPHFPQASKTSIGHVVQLLYRASCFKVSKRECDSSLMQLKEEFRTYETLRREHDAQIVQIATEAGLRIAPDQWSSLLYGDTSHKSHMQSIIDKLQTPQSFGQSVQELVIALQRTGDPGHLSSLRGHLKLLANIDPSSEADLPDWEECAQAMEAVRNVVKGLVYFVQQHGNRKISEAHFMHNSKYKTSMCRDLTQKGNCPRGTDCTFAHSEDELDKYRNRNRKQAKLIAQKQDLQNHSQNSDHSSYTEEPNINSQVNVVHSEEILKPILKRDNLGKVPIIVEELIQPHLVQIAGTSNLLQAGTVRSALTPTGTPIYAAPIGEYSFPQFANHQASIIAQLPAGSTQITPIATPLTPTVGPSAPIYSHPPQHILPPEVFGPNQHIVLNQGTLYNIYARDYPSQVAETKQTKSLSSTCISSWSNQNSHHVAFAQSMGRNRNGEDRFKEINSDVNKKSLTELRELKNEILNKLENIVGKEATDEVANKIEKGETVSTESQFSSMYNIWTTGANLPELTWEKTLKKSWDPSVSYRTNYAKGNHHVKDAIPFDPPITSRFGPISKVSPLTRSYFAPSNAIQVSASNTTDSITTPTVHRPVPAISPVPQVLYQPTGYTLGLVSYPPPLEYMNTVGHGIIDPPHLHMSQLEPSGMRPSDPIMDLNNLDQEENQRVQFIAAKEGIDASSIEVKLEELRLKEELNKVAIGIQEKKKEMEEQNQDDLNDFENNWRFDFDEGDK